MKYRIWSNEHNMWWKPYFFGYTHNIDEAGIFTLDEIRAKNYNYLITATPEDDDFLVGVIENDK